MSDINTEQLVKQAKNGDKNAIDALYRQYSEPLTKFVMKLGLSEFDAQDVVSDTFVEMMKHIDQLREDSYFGTWLHTIAKRKALEFKEKSSRHQRIDLDTADSEDSSLSNIDGEDAIDLAYQDAYGDTVMLPEDYAVNEDIKNIIAEQIASLSPEHKETLFLFYYRNKSLAEIAELAGINQNAAKQRLFKARKALKEKLEKLQKKGVVLCAVPFTSFIPRYAQILEGAVRTSAAASTETAANPASQAASSGSSGIAETAVAKAASAGIGIKTVIITIAAVTAVAVSVLGVSRLASDNGGDDEGSSTSAAIGKPDPISVSDTEPLADSSNTDMSTAESAPDVSDSSEEPEPWREIFISELSSKYGWDNNRGYKGAAYDVDGNGIPEIFMYNPANNDAFQFFAMDNELNVYYRWNQSMVVDEYSGNISIWCSETSSAEKLIFFQEDRRHVDEKTGIYMADAVYPHYFGFDESSGHFSELKEDGQKESARGYFAKEPHIVIVGESFEFEEINDIAEWINSWNGNTEKELVQPEPEKALTPDDLTGWQKAYYDYIHNYKSVNEGVDKVEYGLFDVDGDGIPELLFNAYIGQKATDYGGYIYDEKRIIFVSYCNGEIKETMFTDPEYATSGYTFTGHTAVISTTTPKNAGAQSEFYTERYYKYENGSLTKLPDEVGLEYGRFGFVYRMGNSEISEADYLAFREGIMGDSKVYSSVKRGCSNVEEFVNLSNNTAEAFKMITEYVS